MKKAGTFALVICLLVVAVAAVLCVTYPDLQPKFREFFQGIWDCLCQFFRNFREAFVRR